MTDIEIPTHGDREYLRVFGVVAVYIAASPSNVPCLIGYTRDLGRTLESIRTRWHWSIGYTHAWWVRDQAIAARLIDCINAFVPLDAKGLISVEADTIAAHIERTASSAEVVLTSHSDAMARVHAAVDRVDAVIAAANNSGELRWFNRAYRSWRLGEGEAVAAAVSYGRARALLRDAVVRRIARGDLCPVVGPDLMGEVFPARGEGSAGEGESVALGTGRESADPAKRTDGLKNGSEDYRSSAVGGERERTPANDRRGRGRGGRAPDGN
jgi:hypothetical protein